ncbi:MAG: hypothetical protein ABII64_01135 [Elusimicrobiota bacterium]
MNIPAAQMEIMKQQLSSMSSSMIITGVIGSLAFIMFLLFTKRYFNSGDTTLK